MLGNVDLIRSSQDFAKLRASCRQHVMGQDTP